MMHEDAISDGMEPGAWSRPPSGNGSDVAPSGLMPLWPIPVLILMAATPFACFWFIAYSGVTGMDWAMTAAMIMCMVAGPLALVTVPLALLYPLMVVAQRAWRYWRGPRDGMI